MKRLPTIAAAKRDIKVLQHFVQLAEEHPDRTLNDKAIKLYAYTGSIKETAKIINEEQSKLELPLIEEAFVREVIISKTANPLHKLVKSNYMIKSRPARLR